MGQELLAHSMHAVQEQASIVAFAAYLVRFAEDSALMSSSGTGMPMVLGPADAGLLPCCRVRWLFWMDFLGRRAA